MSWQRPDRREFNQLRPIRFELDYTRYASASVLAHSGDTKVLCNVTITQGVPRFLLNSGQGWLSAEYRMLPCATQERNHREFMKLGGRTQEIQRLIGRSLRAAVDLTAIGERTITIDADVLQADAGTRTISITGGYVALALALKRLVAQGDLSQSPLITQIAAVSVGLLEGKPFLDLNYPEDVAADVDFNVVMNKKMELIEVQGTAESGSYTRNQLNQLLDLAEAGIKQLFASQSQALEQ
jgi:ribonuclease PH